MSRYPKMQELELFWKLRQSRYDEFLASARDRPFKVCKGIPPDQREEILKAVRLSTVRYRNKYTDLDGDL